MDASRRAIDASRRGLVFVNLVDFDTQYGHRNDSPATPRTSSASTRACAAPAASARGRPARHHRRSRQRSDDAEHGPREGVRAAARDGTRCAGVGSRHPRRPSPTLARPSPRTSAWRRCRTARAFCEIPAADSAVRAVDRLAHASIREQLEAREREILAPQAAKSADTRGRLRPEAEDDIRPAFQRDRDRVIHSQGVPPAEAQDAGVLLADGRSLPHAADAHARGLADRAHHREGAAPARGADRGDRARPRPRPHAVRPCRRARARRRSCPAGSTTTSRACASWTSSRTTAAGSTSRGKCATASRKHSKGKGGAPVGVDPSQRASTLEGQIARVADLIAYVNHDIDDAVRAGLLKE